MKNALPALLLASFLATGCSGSSSSKGSSSSGGSGGGCGAITVQGQCTGSVLEYCDPNTGQLDQEDCAQVVPDGGDVYTCQLIDAAYGYDCAAPAGKSCVQIGPEGQSYPSFCQGTGPACVYGTSDATCDVNIPSCVGYDDDGGYAFSGAPANTAACSGAVLLFYCDEIQPVGQDCTAIGGACATDAGSGGACVSLPAQEQCDNILFFCASPLSCIDPDGGGIGYCE